jgi:hypothetical protein
MPKSQLSLVSIPASSDTVNCGAADEAVLKKVLKKSRKTPLKRRFSRGIMFVFKTIRDISWFCRKIAYEFCHFN